MRLNPLKHWKIRLFGKMKKLTSICFTIICEISICVMKRICETKGPLDMAYSIKPYFQHL